MPQLIQPLQQILQSTPKLIHRHINSPHSPIRKKRHHKINKHTRELKLIRSRRIILPAIVVRLPKAIKRQREDRPLGHRVDRSEHGVLGLIDSHIRRVRVAVTQRAAAERLGVAVEAGAGPGVEEVVPRELADGGRAVRAVVVEDVVGAEGLDVGEVGGGAGRDDGEAGELGELDAQDACGCAGAVDEQGDGLGGWGGGEGEFEGLVESLALLRNALGIKMERDYGKERETYACEETAAYGSGLLEGEVVWDLEGKG